MGEALPRGKELIMAFTRKMLEAMGIEADKVESIMESHLEVVNGLKADRDAYKSKLDGIDTTKDWKAEYDKEHAAFESYKADQGSRETRRAKETAYGDLLAAAGVAEKYRSKILKLSAEAIDGLKLDGEGVPAKRDDLIAAIKEEWGTFIPTATVEKHTPATPPATGSPAILTRNEIYARDDRGRFKLNEAERIAAIARNLESQKGL